MWFYIRNTHLSLISAILFSFSSQLKIFLVDRNFIIPLDTIVNKIQTIKDAKRCIQLDKRHSPQLALEPAASKDIILMIGLNCIRYCGLVLL